MGVPPLRRRTQDLSTETKNNEPGEHSYLVLMNLDRVLGVALLASDSIVCKLLL